MAIVFEQVTGEVLPERRPEETREAPPDRAARSFEVEDRVRSILRRERRRAERLSDR